MDTKFITSKRVQILVVVIAAVLIGFGAGNALFHFVTDSSVASKISDGLFIAGVIAYFWSMKLRRQEAGDAKADSERIAKGDDGAVEAKDD